jgi:hypothetical protein
MSDYINKKEPVMKIIWSISLIVLSSLVLPLHSYSEEPNSSLPRMNHMMGNGWGWYGPKSPGVAALLSLQPMPVDFGNFYVDDWGRGIIYTTLELSMFIPGMVIMSDSNMHHNGNNNSWTDNQRVWAYSLLAGYVLTKIISAYDAASTAEHLMNSEHVSLRFNPSDRYVHLSVGVTY